MLQLALNLGLSAAILFLLARLLPGFEIEHMTEAKMSFLIVGFVNFLILPVLAVLRINITFVSLFVLSLIINSLLLNVATGLIDEYDTSSWVAALIGATLLSLIQLLSNVLTEDRRKLIG